MDIETCKQLILVSSLPTFPNVLYKLATSIGDARTSQRHGAALKCSLGKQRNTCHYQSIEVNSREKCCKKGVLRRQFPNLLLHLKVQQLHSKAWHGLLLLMVTSLSEES